MTENRLKEKKSSEGLFINGVECYGWAHDVPGSTSNTEAAEWLMTKPDSSVVSLDAPQILDSLLKMNLNSGGNPALAKEGSLHQIDEAIATKNHILLAGDFISQHATKDRENKEWQTTFGIVGSILAASLLTKWTRRNFLKIVSVSPFLLWGAAKTFNLIHPRATARSINEQDYSSLIARINDTYNDPNLSDMVARTGIVLAKHLRIREVGFLETAGYQPSNVDLSIWGLAHLDTKDDIRLIKKIIQDPRSETERILERDMAYLIGIGTSQSEAIEWVAFLRTCIASTIPMNLIDKNDRLEMISPGGFKVFLDDRILGFSAKTPAETLSKARSRAQYTYYQLTDDRGNLNI